MSKRKNKSDVWDFFEKDAIDSQFASCVLCKKTYRTSGNTSNLKDHIKRQHKTELCEHNELELSDADNVLEVEKIPKKLKVQSKLTLFSTKMTYERNNKKKIKVDHLVAMMIARDFQPFSVVQDRGLNDIINALDPQYKLPSKTTIRDQLIPQLFEKAERKVCDILKNTQHVALTTDMWTSISVQAYITITCHFVYNGALKSLVLETSEVETAHTAENISIILETTINRWFLNQKVAAVVTDNAASMIKACSLIKLRHVPCFAHSLNLVVKDLLSSHTRISNDINELSQILQKCRNIVTHFKKSAISMDKLREEQKKRGKSYLKPIQDVPTRWNSTYLMLQRILTLNEDDCLVVTLSKIKNAPETLVFNEQEIIREITMILSIFNDATEKISGDKYITISLIIPLVLGLFNKLENLEQKLCSHVAKKSCSVLKASVVKRLFHYEERTAPRIATLLDPRLKRHAFRSQDNVEQTKLAVQNELSTMLEKTKNFQITTNAQLVEPTASTLSSGTDSACTDLLGFINERKQNFQRSSTSTTDAIVTLRRFLDLENLPINANPILFWTKQRNQFNGLENIVNHYFCIPATSVSSERVFSKAGELISKRRANLKPKNVNKLIFLNQNSWVLDLEEEFGKNKSQNS